MLAECLVERAQPAIRDGRTTYRWRVQRVDGIDAICSGGERLAATYEQEARGKRARAAASSILRQRQLEAALVGWGGEGGVLREQNAHVHAACEGDSGRVGQDGWGTGQAEHASRECDRLWATAGRQIRVAGNGLVPGEWEGGRAGTGKWHPIREHTRHCGLLNGREVALCHRLP